MPINNLPSLLLTANPQITTEMSIEFQKRLVKVTRRDQEMLNEVVILTLTEMIHLEMAKALVIMIHLETPVPQRNSANPN